MKRTILYYPTINIPSDSWLRHSLLYWDEVSSIVPKSWDDKILTSLSKDIHYLIDEGQFRPVKPEDLISKNANWQEFENFIQEFKEIIISPHFKALINRNQFFAGRKYRIHENKINSYLRIHHNKISDNIIDFLKEENLIESHPHHEWIYFERNTALLYMSLLAKYLADIDSNYTTIGTDNNAYEGLNFKRVSEENGFPVISCNLNNILPTPLTNVPLKKIISFKKQREQNLRHFQSTISDFQRKISTASSRAEIKDITYNFEGNLINGVNDLSATLNDHKIDFAVKSVKSLINLKTPTSIASALTLVDSVANLDYLHSIPLSLKFLGLGTMGAVELTTNYIENNNKQRAKLRESPFSYVYYARKKNLIK